MLHSDFLKRGTVRLHGPLGDMLDKVVKNRLKKIDYRLLADPFRYRNEADGKWRCEFWGKVVRSAAYAWKSTHAPELKELIDHTVAEFLAAQTPDGCIRSYPAEKQLDGLGTCLKMKSHDFCCRIEHYRLKIQ